MSVIASTSPSRPAPRRHQRGGAGTWLLALLVLGGIAFAVYWFVLRDQATGGQLARSVVPASADGMIGIDAAGLLSSPDVEKLVKTGGVDIAQIKARLADAGIKIESLGAVVLAADLEDARPPEVMLAIEAQADVKAAEAAIQAVRTLLPPELGRAIDLSNVQVFDGLVLAGAGPFFDRAKDIAAGRAGAAELSAPLAEVRGAIDTKAHLWAVAALPPEVLARLDLGPLTKSFGAAKPTHAAASVRIGSKIDLAAAFRLEGGSAKAIADSMSGGLSVLGLMAGKEMGAILDALDIGSTGSTLTVSLSLAPDQLAVLAKVKNLF